MTATRILNAFFTHAATTQGVTVRVAVSFMADQSQPRQSRWFWGYHIRIENGGAVAVQLITRHWEITDGNGALHLVDGEGVIGEQPVIIPGGAYDYVSACPLATSSGRMTGSFQMISADGTHFDAAIPAFLLNAPVERA